MKYNETEISKLWDQELKAAYIDLAERHNALLDARNTEKFKKKMQNQPEPPINEMFTNLQNEIAIELKKRHLEF
jgi:hypothetical protein